MGFIFLIFAVVVMVLVMRPSKASESPSVKPVALTGEILPGNTPGVSHPRSDFF